jgi:hypothetical protein
MPSAYNQFVSKHIRDPKIAHLAQKDRMRAVAKLWHESKGMHNYEVKEHSKKGKRSAKKAHADGFLDDVLGAVQGGMKLLPLMGLGMKHKKKSGDMNAIKNELLQEVAKPKRRGRKAQGGDFNDFDQALDGLKTGFSLPFKLLGSFA